MDTKFNHVPHDPAAYAELHQRISGLELEQDAAAAGQPVSTNSPRRSGRVLQRPDGMPAGRRVGMRSLADGPMRRRAPLPRRLLSATLPSGSRTAVGEASSSRQSPPNSPVLPEGPHRSVYPAAEFSHFRGISTIVGAMYERPPAAYGIPPDIKYAPMAEPMVRCSDGAVRRFPRAEGDNDRYFSQLGKGIIYDVPAKYVTKRMGGINLAADAKHAAFEVNGNAVSPIQVGWQFKAYPLGNGKVLVPQPGFRDCTEACELMMMFDHGHINRETAHGYEAALGKTRETANMMASLRRRTGCTPILVEHDLSYKTGLFGAVHSSRKQAWRDLASKLNEMGPCILRKSGHMVMLDGIREANGQFHLSIRDPFHGTAVEFRDTAKFFADQFGTPDRAHIEAVFLKRPT